MHHNIIKMGLPKGRKNRMYRIIAFAGRKIYRHLAYTYARMLDFVSAGLQTSIPCLLIAVNLPVKKFDNSLPENILIKVNTWQQMGKNRFIKIAAPISFE